MADGETYTLTFTQLRGAFTVTAAGYGAEPMMDQRFNEVVRDPRTLFAIVHHAGGIRRKYVAPEIAAAK